jgi:ribonuclease BN (tRNA processing enzyme)
MKLHILGSGTCIPYERRGSSGYALRLSKSTILLDCGNGATWKLGRVGINYLELDHIFLSHLHPDHTSDLIPFLFATKYATPHKRVKPFYVWGGDGFKNFFSLLSKAYNDWIMPDKLNIEEIKEGEMSFDDFKIIARKTPHIDSSLAYRIESQGRSLVYSGDTDYSESLVEIAKDADLLIIECSMPDRFKVKGHLTPAEVSRIANESRAKRLLISHLYPISDELDVISAIRNDVKAEAVLAEDLLEVEI